MSQHDAHMDTSRHHVGGVDQHASLSSGNSSATTLAARTTDVRKAGTSRLADQVRALPEPVRLQMSLIARGANSSEEALEPIIELLVDGSVAKRAAIANAFRTNEPLREQWERTYEILRG